MEIWKAISGYEGLYEVSSLGRVRSKDRFITNENDKTALHKGRVISPGKRPNGYLFVGLSKSGKRNLLAVHRLVAIEFLPCSNNETLQVNHINENKEDNRLENLEWCTAKENIRHSVNTGKQTGRNPNKRKKLTPEKVNQIVGLAQDGVTHRSIALKYGVSKTMITKVVNNQLWPHRQQS